jgi:hypothetical protein
MISLEVTRKRLHAIAELAAAGSFDRAAEQAKVLAEDLGRASRPAYPNYKAGRGGQMPTWDAHHQRYAAALPHVRAAHVRAGHGDSEGVAESVDKACAALGPVPEAKAESESTETARG